MSNPLKSMMPSNNLGNMFSSVMNTSPQQMAMSMLQKRNPQGYQMLQQMMQSGKNPQDILNQLTANMDPQQIAQIKQIASQFGIK